MGKKRARITARSPSPAEPLGVEPRSSSKKQRKSKEEVQLEEAVFGFAAKEDEGERTTVKAGKAKLVEQDNGLGHVADQDVCLLLPEPGRHRAHPST